MRKKFKVVTLTEAERSQLWSVKALSNVQTVNELRLVAEARKAQLESLNLETLAVDQFITYLNVVSTGSSNPYSLRLPSPTLLGVVPGKQELNDPLNEWLKQNFESNIQHGYHVEGEQLQVRDEALFEAHKVAVLPRFLQDTLSAQSSCIAFFSTVKDNYNATGEVTVAAYGEYESLTVIEGG